MTELAGPRPGPVAPTFAFTRRRRVVDRAYLAFAAASTVAAIAVLGLILGYVLVKGAAYLNWTFLTHLPQPLGEPGGGVANSIFGTLQTVALASVIGIPLGIGVGVYATEYARPRVASAIRFVADVLTGVPSIVIGVVVFEVLVTRMGHFSALAAGVALAMIMLPIVARASEEMLKLVPSTHREAALALGIPRWRTTLSVIIPAAKRGLVTGGLLAVARAAGETAPLIFTALGNRFWTTSVTGGPVDTLPLRIWRYGIGPYDDWHQQAWAASFILVMMVLLISIAARALAGRGR